MGPRDLGPTTFRALPTRMPGLEIWSHDLCQTRLPGCRIQLDFGGSRAQSVRDGDLEFCNSATIQPARKRTSKHRIAMKSFQESTTVSPASPGIDSQRARISFENTYARLPERFHARLNPTPVAAPRLIKLNTDLARKLGPRSRDAGEPGRCRDSGRQSRRHQDQSRWRWRMPGTSLVSLCPGSEMVARTCWGN